MTHRPLLPTPRQAHNQSFDNTCTIDLHGLHVAEAVAKAAATLDNLEALPSPMALKVVCGRGGHSENGEPRVLPAVKALLAERNVHYEEQHGGSLVVRLRASR